MDLMMNFWEGLERVDCRRTQLGVWRCPPYVSKLC